MQFIAKNYPEVILPYWSKAFLLQIVKMSLLSTPKKEDAIAGNGAAVVDIKCENSETTSGMEVVTDFHRLNVRV